MKSHIFILFVLFASLMSGCTPAKSVKSNLPPLRVEFTEWWGDYTIIIAEKQGLFEKHGVAVEAIYYPDFSKALPDLTANKIDAGLFTITDVINTANITGVNAVAMYDDGGQVAVVTTPDINSVEDLKGKRIGVSVGSTYEMFILEMLATAGLTSADVTIIDFSAEQGVLEALGNDMDAVFSWEPYTSEAIAAGNNVVFSSKELSNLYPDLITFRSMVVQERREDVRAFLAAWFEAVDFRLQNPEQTNQIIADYFKIPLDQLSPDDQLHIMTLAENKAIYKQENTGSETSIYEITKINAEFLLRIGALSKMPDTKQLFDASFLP